VEIDDITMHPASPVPTEVLPSASEAEGKSDSQVASPLAIRQLHLQGNSENDEHASDDSDTSTVESEGQVPEIQRTQSQMAKQQQVCRVVSHLAERKELIQDLKRISSKLEDEFVAEHHDLLGMLATVSEAQKQARNLGEDLMEDLLKLDSLSNLVSEDRMTRKSAISVIESLLSTVDTAKVELVIFRKKLEAKLSEKAQVPENTKVDKSSSASVSQNASPKRTSNRESTEEQNTPAKTVTKLRRIAETPRQTPARCSSRENLLKVSAVPGCEFWEQFELPVEFMPYEQRHAYVVEASVPELDIKDLKLRMSSDQSQLVVEGVRLPTSAQKLIMQREVASRLEQFARKCPNKFIQLGGAPSLSQEAFAKVGEGHFGRFSRIFSIPDDVDVADIEASYCDGKVRVVLPKKRVALGHLATPSESYYGRHVAHPFHHMGMPFF